MKIIQFDKNYKPQVGDMLMVGFGEHTFYTVLIINVHTNKTFDVYSKLPMHTAINALEHVDNVTYHYKNIWANGDRNLYGLNAYYFGKKIIKLNDYEFDIAKSLYERNLN